MGQRRVRSRGHAQALGEGIVRVVVQVVLSAEEHHFVRDQRLIDGGRRLSIQFTEPHAIDACTDVLAQLHDTKITTHWRVPFGYAACSRLCTRGL